MTISTTSIDIMGLQAAYANLHTDQERDYFMQRYHDVISSFGGKTSYDADNRPLRSEERFSRNAETDLVCRPLLEHKKTPRTPRTRPNTQRTRAARAVVLPIPPSILQYDSPRPPSSTVFPYTTLFRSTLWVCKLLMLICILTKNVITSCSVTMMLFLHLEVKPLMTLTTVLYLSCALISGHLAMMLMELTKRR